MKKFKILLLLLIVSVAGFYSCSDNDPVENDIVASKSIALRTTLNEIKKANNINGRNSVAAQDQAFCFNFVFPLTLAYNDGTVITIASYQGLIDVLTSETPVLYIEGVVFPFQVQQEGAIITIENEAEFFALIQDCNFYTVNNTVFDFTCYSIVFPISVINANQETIVVNSQTELLALVTNSAGTVNYQLNIVFPISVVQNNQTIVINNLYEFFDLNNDCPSSSCICTADYNPVCVQTPNGIVEYSNMCHAECAGYTQSDLVPCAPACNITNVTTTPGTCNANGTYPLTIDFDYANTTSNEFYVYNSAGVLVGSYPLSSLPVTIPNYQAVAAGADYLVVRIGTNFDCNATQQWAVPACQTTSGNFGTQLGTCFNIAFPVQIQFQGALVTANSNGDILQYYFPAQSNIPAFVYPLTVTFNTATGPITVIVASQAAFEAAINNNCN
ncbi:Kazal-type serine protease inhibitor family protein [Flavobacterium sp.]|uniref:Kazal-type serine protease inhibitor family protein n=1 Tax=Flavobacterium sp. TaxID=239 RepID=UPI002FDD7188